MSKKEKDVLKKQQEKLQNALEILDIDEHKFLHMLKENPEEVRDCQ